MAKKKPAKKKPAKVSKLTPKQERFCQEYVIDLNGTQAAIRAGYSENCAKEQASDLLTKPNIQGFIKELQEKIGKRLEITSDMVVRELWTVGSARIDDYVSVIEKEEDVEMFGEEPEEGEEAAIMTKKVVYKCVDIKLTKEISQDKIGAIESIKQGRSGIEIKLHDKVKSLELVGRHLGIFEKDNAQQSNKISVKLNK